MNLFHHVTRRVIMTAFVMLLAGVGALQAQWTEAPIVPVGPQLIGMSANYVNGKIYLIGGTTDGQVTQRGIYTLSSSSPTSWVNAGTLPVGLMFHSSAVANGKIYIFGGETASNVRSLKTYVYDPATSSIVPGPDMPRDAAAASAVTVDGKIYIMGGLTTSGGNSVPTQSILVFDPAGAGTFTNWNQPGRVLPAPVYFPLLTTVGSDVYFMGGPVNQQQIYTGAFKGSIGPNGVTWTQIANLPVVTAQAAAGIIDGKPFVAGGTGNASNYYDSQTNTWKQYYPIPTGYTFQLSTMAGDGEEPFLIAGSGRREVFQARANLKPSATIGSTTVRVAVQQGQERSINFIVGNVMGAAPLTAEFTTGSQAWITGAGESTIEAGSAGLVEATVSAGSLAPGVYNATGRIVTNDDLNERFDVNVELWVVEDLALAPYVAVIEEASGAWCPPCGAFGIPALEQVHETFGDRVHVLSLHDHGGHVSRFDPFATTEIEALNGRLQVPYFPAAAFQRTPIGGSMMVGSDNFFAAAASLLAQNEYADAVVTIDDYEYNPTTRQVDATVTISTSSPIDWQAGNSLRLTAFVVQDSMLFWQQGIDANQDGNADNIYHRDVVRDIAPNIEGLAITVPTTALQGEVLKPGESFTTEISFTVPAQTVPVNVVQGQPSSVAIDAAESEIVFLAHINKGTAPGPILGLAERELMSEVTGPAISINIPQNTKTVPVNTTATFDISVTNNSTEAVEVTLQRLQNQLAAGWTSEICKGTNDCDDANNVVLSVPAGSTHTFTLKVNATSAENATGTVRLMVGGAGVTQEQLFTVTSTGGTGVEVPATIGGLSLKKVTPNPVAEVANLTFTLPTAGMTTVELFTVGGEKVGTFVDERLEAGLRTATLDVKSLEAGKYIVRLTHNGTAVSTTITVVR